MRLGLQLGYDDPVAAVALAEHAERLGFDCVWTSEAWGADAITPLAWIAARTERIGLGTAIMQMPARTPAATAMAAATLDRLSGGRVRIGLGTSGPQVVEGWHGQQWGRPLQRTREYVEIVRTALARRTLEHHGEHYDIPFAGDGATGLGKPLKLLLRPLRGSIPIYLAALGPRNVELAAEIGDGWLPIFFSPERAAAVHRPHLEVDAARDALKPQLALYVGGMGSRDANFYNRLACRYGYAAEAARIQDLYLDGRKNDAAAAVPDALVDEVALVGSRERIADRLAAWRESGATSINAQARQPDALEVLAELLL